MEAQATAEKIEAEINEKVKEKVDAEVKELRRSTRGSIKPVYDDEAKEADVDEAEEDTDIPVIERKKRKSNAFNYEKFAEVVAENFNEEQMGIIDVVLEYSIKKFQDLKERNVDLTKIQIRNPFVEREDRPSCMFVSQELPYGY